ncbi:MAG: D-tyrosyl-tRNA(Tyr) deacylase [Chloroflexi bacterium]|nr:D-tyrosyl-tRNA(Tyr) deacylase [Chloroflexota bacterium]
MRALLQRVSKASVSVNQEEVGVIGAGLLIFVGIAQGDSEADARYLVDKVVNLRIFPDEQGRFDRSVIDVQGALLLVSQFTLHADTRKGRRPSFTEAAPPEVAGPLFERLVAMARKTGLRVETGRFQEHMVVRLENDGPVTIMLNSADRHRPRSGT